MPVKVAKDGSSYGGAMLTALIRWLTIASLVLMPFGMSSSPAAAAGHHAAAGSMPCEGHEQPSKTTPDKQTHCTSCVALAEPQPAAAAVDFPPVPVLVDRVGELLMGLEPEVATPPPKRV